MKFPYPGQPVIVKSSRRSADLGSLMIVSVTNPSPFDPPPPIVMASVTYQDNGQYDVVSAGDIEPVYPQQLSWVEITLVEPIKHDPKVE